MSRCFLRACVWGVLVLSGMANNAAAQLPPNEGLRKPSMSWIDIADDAMYRAPVFTAECLLRVRAGGLIVTRDVSSGSPSDWQLYFDPSTRRIAFITASNPPDSYFYTDSTFEYGRWYHIALVVNGPMGRAALYVDGRRMLTAAFSSRLFNGSTGLAWGGYYGNASGAYLDGDFDEARYWSVERTPAQISANMLRRLDINDRAGLIGYWMFCGNVADSSGAGHHATVHAAPAIVAFPELPLALSCGTAPLRLAPDSTLILCRNSCAILRAGVLTGSPPYRYAWTNASGAPLGSDDTLRICPATSTTVMVQVTDTMSDIAVRTFRITVLPQPVIAISGPRRVCTGGEAQYLVSAMPADSLRVTMSDSSTPLRVDPPAGFTFRWDAPDTVRLRVRAWYQGCEREDSTTIIIERGITPVITALGSTRFCEGDSLTLEASTAAGWRWSTGETTRRIIVRAGGRYWVTTTAANGCTATSDTVTVDVIARPAITLEGPRLVCVGSHARFVVGATPRDSLQVTWVSTQPDTVLTGAAPDTLIARWDSPCTTSLRLRVVVGPCVYEDTIVVVVTDALRPVIAASGPLTLCDGDSVVLDASAADTHWRWSTGDSTRSITVRTGGRYWVQVRDASGCEGTSDTVEVVVNRPPVVTLTGPRTVCVGAVAAYDYASQFTDSSLFVWERPDWSEYEIPEWPGRLLIRCDSPRVLVFRITGWSGACVVRDSLVISVVDAVRPVITALGATSLCDGDSLVLEASAAASWRWNTGDSTRRITVRTSGRYSVSTTDTVGCGAASDTVEVTVRPRPTARITGVPFFCEGDSTVLAVGDGPYASVLWSDGSTGAQLTLRSAARVTVTVSDSAGCTASAGPLDVIVHPRPSQPAIWRLGDSLYCTPAPSIQWYRDGVALAGETGPILRITADGAYSVRVASAYGCDSTSLALQAAPGGGDCLVWIPHLEGSTGERIDVPVIATCADALRLAGTARAAVTLARREGILFERPPVAAGTHAADERVVDLDIDLAAAAGDTIARLPFTVMLGPVRETPLRIARIAFAPVDRAVRTRDGSFRLRVCEEGGERLFDADVRMDLTARGGSPFNADLVVDYTLPAEASARLVLVDALGRTVAVLADGVQAKGAHTVRHAGTALASGVYLCVLTAENMRRVVAVHHLK